MHDFQKDRHFVRTLDTMKSEMEEPLIDYTENPTKGVNDIENDFNFGNNVLSSSADVRKAKLK